LAINRSAFTESVSLPFLLCVDGAGQSKIDSLREAAQHPQKKKKSHSLRNQPWAKGLNIVHPLCGQADSKRMKKGGTASGLEIYFQYPPFIFFIFFPVGQCGCFQQ
jgi:hypothetical protein